jgi:hypothetical protein
MLVLRSCAADLTSRCGTFQYPASGPVACSDWIPKAECGNGLHGFPWGEGDYSLADHSPQAKWLVIDVRDEDVVLFPNGSKCKFPGGNVVFCGDLPGAAKYLMDHGAVGKSVIGGVHTAGTRGTATAGDAGTATAGDAGTATAGTRGTATAGDAGTATAGTRGTATAGDAGTATAGYAGTATAGEKGLVQIAYWDAFADRVRIKTGYIGENGIEAGVTYKLDEHFDFVALKQEPANA